MRHLAHLAARLFNTPLLLQPAAADAFGHAFGSLLHGDAAPVTVVLPGSAQAAESTMPEREAYAGNVRPGAGFEDKPYLVTAEGIALLPVLGPLVQRAGQMTPDCTPVTSYQRLAARFEQMLADNDVRGILFEFDSPGGEAAGMFDLAQRIAAQRSTKPIWGHANEAAFSAGYGLAAAVERLHAPQAGALGSIGVVMLHVDQSQRDAKQGLVFTPIFAGARKIDFNSHAPLSETARASAQGMVDQLYDQFTTHVATARSMDLKTVRGTEAGIFGAAEAKAIGLIDGVSSFSETLAEFAAHIASVQHGRTGSVGFQRSPSGSRLAATPGSTATTPQKGNASMADSTPAADQAAIDTARAEGHAAGLAEGTKQGAAAERTRVGAILNHSAAATRGKLATKLALETDMSADTAGTVLLAAAEEQPAAAPAPAPAASPLAAAMAGVPNPAVGADGGNTGAAGAEADTPKATAASVIRLFNQSRGAQA
jgi:ClpP class serine protease